MKALVIDRPGEARVVEMEPTATDPLEATMRIRRIGLCGTDLSTFLGAGKYVPQCRRHGVVLKIIREPTASDPARN